MKLLIYILAIGLMSFKDYGNPYPFHVRFKGSEKELNILVKWLKERK